MDIKVATRRKQKRTFNLKMKPSVPRLPRLNEMVVKWSIAAGTLATSTSGIISSSSFSPTIANSSEFSAYSTMFTEVKLLRCWFIFNGKQQSGNTGSPVLQGRITVGTNMVANANSHTNPASQAQVCNLTRVKRISTYSTSPQRYNFAVPGILDFANISADAPSTVTPWAGSPGALYIYGDNLTASTDYIDVDMICVHRLRGRQ